MTEKKNLVIDVHCHASGVEVQDIVDEYDKIFTYGMSHRDNLLLMDAVGVDVQVIQCGARQGTAYRNIHQYTRRVMREHPDRFLSIVKGDERKMGTNEFLEQIREYVEDWGFKGWWLAPWSKEDLESYGLSINDFPHPNPLTHFDHEKYDPVWEMVESLRVPAAITSHPQNFETMGHNLLNVLDKHPDLIVQIVHGIDPPSCLMSDGSVAIPESMISAVKNYNVYLELLPGLDGMTDSPNRYGPNDEVIKAFYDTFGPSRLMWGSEFTSVWLPTVNQYRYQFEYLKNHCEYMTDEDLALIMGGNAMRIYGLQ